MNSFYRNDGALAAYDTHVLTLGNVLSLVGNSLPYVTVNLNATETISLDSLHHPTMTVHECIGIAHTLVLAFVQIALGKGSYIDKCYQ